MISILEPARTTMLFVYHSDYHLTPPYLYRLSFPPQPGPLVEDITTLNIPQIYGTLVDIHIGFMWSYIYTPSLFAILVSRIITLIVPYDDYLTYACTYVALLSPSVEQRYCQIEFAKVQFYRRMNIMWYSMPRPR
jgi:hypothetical protein